MENVTDKDKNDILAEIANKNPSHHIIDDYHKHRIIGKYLKPDGYVTIGCEYDQDNMIAYCITQKGLDFIKKGGYKKEPISISSIFNNKTVRDISVGVSITVIATLILFYIFGIKNT